MASRQASYQALKTLRSMLLAAGLGASTLAFAEPPVEPAPVAPTKFEQFTSRASELTLQALSMIGIRYKLGGNLPESGLDCSGLVRYVFKTALGKELPRTSEEISHVGQAIDARDLQPGDLVFYNTLRRSFSHVGIYLGNNKFIHAPSSGGTVRIESMDVNYWKSRFSGARRIATPEPDAAPSP